MQNPGNDPPDDAGRGGKRGKARATDDDEPSGPRGKRTSEMRVPRQVHQNFLIRLGQNGSLQRASDIWNRYLEDNPGETGADAHEGQTGEVLEIIQIFQYEDGLIERPVLDNSGTIARWVMGRLRRGRETRGLGPLVPSILGPIAEAFMNPAPRDTNMDDSSAEPAAVDPAPVPSGDAMEGITAGDNANAGNSANPGSSDDLDNRFRNMRVAPERTASLADFPYRPVYVRPSMAEAPEPPGDRGRTTEGLREPRLVSPGMLTILRQQGILQAANDHYNGYLRAHPEMRGLWAFRHNEPRVTDVIRVFQYEDQLIEAGVLRGSGPVGQAVHARLQQPGVDSRGFPPQIALNDLGSITGNTGTRTAGTQAQQTPTVPRPATQRLSLPGNALDGVSTETIVAPRAPLFTGVHPRDVNINRLSISFGLGSVGDPDFADSNSNQPSTSTNAAPAFSLRGMFGPNPINPGQAQPTATIQAPQNVNQNDTQMMGSGEATAASTLNPDEYRQIEAGEAVMPESMLTEFADIITGAGFDPDGEITGYSPEVQRSLLELVRTLVAPTGGPVPSDEEVEEINGALNVMTEGQQRFYENLATLHRGVRTDVDTPVASLPPNVQGVLLGFVRGLEGRPNTTTLGGDPDYPNTPRIRSITAGSTTEMPGGSTVAASQGRNSTGGIRRPSSLGPNRRGSQPGRASGQRTNSQADRPGSRDGTASGNRTNSAGTFTGGGPASLFGSGSGGFNFAPGSSNRNLYTDGSGTSPTTQTPRRESNSENCNVAEHQELVAQLAQAQSDLTECNQSRETLERTVTAERRHSTATEEVRDQAVRDLRDLQRIHNDLQQRHLNELRQIRLYDHDRPEDGYQMPPGNEASDVPELTESHEALRQDYVQSEADLTEAQDRVKAAEQRITELTARNEELVRNQPSLVLNDNGITLLAPGQAMPEGSSAYDLATLVSDANRLLSERNQHLVDHTNMQTERDTAVQTAQDLRNNAPRIPRIIRRDNVHRVVDQDDMREPDDQELSIEEWVQNLNNYEQRVLQDAAAVRERLARGECDIASHGTDLENARRRTEEDAAQRQRLEREVVNHRDEKATAARNAADRLKEVQDDLDKCRDTVDNAGKTKKAVRFPGEPFKAVEDDYMEDGGAGEQSFTLEECVDLLNGLELQVAARTEEATDAERSDRDYDQLQQDLTESQATGLLTAANWDHELTEGETSYTLEECIDKANSINRNIADRTRRLGQGDCGYPPHYNLVQQRDDARAARQQALDLHDGVQQALDTVNEENRRLRSRVEQEELARETTASQLKTVSRDYAAARAALKVAQEGGQSPPAYLIAKQDADRQIEELEANLARAKEDLQRCLDSKDGSRGGKADTSPDEEHCNIEEHDDLEAERDRLRNEQNGYIGERDDLQLSWNQLKAYTNSLKQAIRQYISHQDLN